MLFCFVLFFALMPPSAPSFESTAQTHNLFPSAENHFILFVRVHVSNQCQTKLDSTSTRLHLCWFPIRIGGGDGNRVMAPEDGRRPKWWRAVIYICLSSQPSIYLCILFQLGTTLAMRWRDGKVRCVWCGSENSYSYCRVLMKLNEIHMDISGTHNAENLFAKMSKNVWKIYARSQIQCVCVTNLCLCLSKMYCMLVFCLSFNTSIFERFHTLCSSFFFSFSSCGQVSIWIVL